MNPTSKAPPKDAASARRETLLAVAEAARSSSKGAAKTARKFGHGAGIIARGK